MDVAFLFNADSPELGYCYGFPIKMKILGSPIFDKYVYHLKISFGDICTYGEPIDSKAFDRVYKPYLWDRRKVLLMKTLLSKITVYCCVFRNCSKIMAEDLNCYLSSESWYLGAHDLDFSNFYHLTFFKAKLIEKYRLQRRVDSTKECKFFYSSLDGELNGNFENHFDMEEINLFKSHRFNVNYEDNGARKTIFDTYYDSIEHYTRIKKFSDFFKKNLSWNEGDVEGFCLNIEDLHPYLFNIFYAAVNALINADVIEQLNQMFFSARRFIEHFADFLYPSSDKPHIGNNGKSYEVTGDKHGNRIIAYVEETLNAKNKFEKSVLEELYKAIFKVIRGCNVEIHTILCEEEDFDKKRLECNNFISDLAKVIYKIINIDILSVSRPYLAYNNNIKRMFSEMLSNGDE